MLQNLPFKKEYILWLGVLLIFFVIYEFSIKSSIQLYQENISLQQSFEASTDLAFQPEYLNRKNKNIDKILKGYRQDSTSFRESTIAEISYIAESENVRLIEIPSPDPFYSTNGFIVQPLDFEGDYFSILKMLKTIQNKKTAGVLTSVSLSTISPNNQNIKKLTTRLYLQISK